MHRLGGRGMFFFNIVLFAMALYYAELTSVGYSY